MNIARTSFNPVALSNLNRAAAPASSQQTPSEATGSADSFTFSGAEESKESRLSYMAKGALIGGAAGLILPGIVVPLIGFAASPITGPIGLVFGAIAGASAFDHPDYKPN